jgi:PAS domain S-box-containing protein
MKQMTSVSRAGFDEKEASRVGGVLEESPGQAEELYRKIFEHSNDAIFVMDPGRDSIVDANPRACAMLGYSREELLSLTISAIHPHEITKLQSFAESVFRDGSGWTNELSCLAKGGHQVPSEISASTVEVAGQTRIIAMVRDITERRQAEQAQRQLAVVEERNRLAREIHDSLAQGLTAIIWQLNAAEGQAEAGGEHALESLKRIRELARESLQEARRSVYDLRSGPLKGQSLVGALRQETDKATGDHIQTSFNVEGKRRVLPGGVEASLLRICQEALANVLKHANAGRVAVTIAFNEARVHLTVEDDGIGFDPVIPKQWDRDSGGFGLVSMRERAQLLGGELTLESAIGRGTVVKAALPLK